MKNEFEYPRIGCDAFIFDEKKRLLLMKRTDNCQNRSGYWITPGGGIELNEKNQDALKREVKEELGITIGIEKLIGVFDDIIPEENQHWISIQYLCKIISGEVQNVELPKCEKIDWFYLDAIPKKVTIPTLQGIEKLSKSI